LQTEFDNAAQCTVDPGTDTFTSNGHGFNDDDQVYVSAEVAPTGMVLETRRYVINSTANTFQLSTSLGGGAIDMTTAGTDVRVYPEPDYNSYTRPTISPNGTKAVFHSSQLQNLANKTDVYIAVVFYPKPPTNLAAVTAGGGGARIQFLLPTYTSRRWINSATGLIDEVAGDILWDYETENVRLWRQPAAAGGGGIDSADSRREAINVPPPVPHVLPDPDGEISARNRAMLLGLYGRFYAEGVVGPMLKKNNLGAALFNGSMN
jgi:hypothetical protein